MRAIQKAFFVSTLTLLAAGTASANTDGQYGFTGRSDSCLRCHGTNQYAGLEVTVSGLGTPIDCFVGEELEKLTLPTLAFGDSVEVKISLAEPGDSDGLECPAHDCCAETNTYDESGNLVSAALGEAPQESLCQQDDFRVDGVATAAGTCSPFLAACLEPLAGYNMEVVNGGAFSIPDGDTSSRLRQNGDELVASEVTHVLAGRFDNGPAEWTVNYTAPAEADYQGALEFWVGANVANGNGKADQFDLNSNYQLTVALGDKVPDFCATCEDGSLPDENGQCPGGFCSCAKLPTGSPWAGLALLGGLVLLSRRRR
jgi:hypothetical protein